MNPPDRLGRWQLVLRAALYAAGGARALIETIGQRQAMNPDAIGYLEVGAGWLAEGPRALSVYWHPVYSVALRLAAALFPGREWDAVAGHLLNFALFVAGWLLFRQFARALPTAGDGGDRGWMELVADAVYLWASLRLGQLWLLTPDFVVACVVFGSATLVLKAAERPRAWGAYLGLGVCLAGGYWTKAIVFHYGWALLACLLVAPGRLARPRIAAGAALFMALVAAHGLLVYEATGRFSLTEGGRVAYLVEVNRVTAYEAAESNRAARIKIERIAEGPAVYKIEARPDASHALTYDPAAVFFGMRTRFDAGEQGAALGRNVRETLRFLGRDPFVWLALGVMVAGAIRGRGTNRASGPLALWLAPAAAWGMYLLVYIEPRYVFAFVALLLFPGLAGGRPGRCWQVALVCAATLLLAADSVRYARYFQGRQEAPKYVLHQRLAEALRKAGLRPGDPAGLIGFAQEAYFAHLLGLRITAEAPTRLASAPWPGTEEALEKAAAAIFTTGAKVAVVTEGAVPEDGKGWRGVPGTPFHYRLKGEEAQR